MPNLSSLATKKCRTCRYDRRRNWHWKAERLIIYITPGKIKAGEKKKVKAYLCIWGTGSPDKPGNVPVVSTKHNICTWMGQGKRQTWIGQGKRQTQTNRLPGVNAQVEVRNLVVEVHKWTRSGEGRVPKTTGWTKEAIDNPNKNKLVFPQWLATNRSVGEHSMFDRDFTLSQWKPSNDDKFNPILPTAS